MSPWTKWRVSSDFEPFSSKSLGFFAPYGHSEWHFVTDFRYYVILVPCLFLFKNVKTIRFFHFCIIFPLTRYIENGILFTCRTQLILILLSLAWNSFITNLSLTKMSLCQRNLSLILTHLHQNGGFRRTRRWFTARNRFAVFLVWVFISKAPISRTVEDNVGARMKTSFVNPQNVFYIIQLNFIEGKPLRGFAGWCEWQIIDAKGGQIYDDYDEQKKWSPGYSRNI